MLINAIKSGDTDDKQRSSVKKVKVISEGPELKKTSKLDWLKFIFNYVDKDNMIQIIYIVFIMTSLKKSDVHNWIIN